MTRYHRLTVGALVATLAIAAVALHAQGPRGPRMRAGGPGMAAGLPLRALDLTENQEMLVKEIRDRHREALAAARRQLDKARAAQRTAAEVTPVDEAGIRATSQALAEAETAVAIETAGIRTEIVAVLTPEQQTELQEVQAKQQERMKQRRERMRERMKNRPRPGGA